MKKIEKMQKKIIRLIYGLGLFGTHYRSVRSAWYIDIQPFTKLIEYNVIKFMKQFENNKLQDGFENEWSRRLVEGWDGLDICLEI